MSQAALLRKRRFSPFFATQFFGAFNDNLFKNALMVTVAYRSATLAGMSTQTVVAMAAGLFILPYFLFSAWAGQLADKVSKTTLIQWVKVAELVFMAGAALGFWLDSLPLLLFVLFLMGLQSAFFGPAKYSILPELLSSRELTGGNALVETGTFIAILLGTIAGGLLAGDHVHTVGVCAIAVAGLGILSSLFIPHTRPADPTLRLTLNPVTPAIETYRSVRTNKSVFLSVLGISWFWFLGASFLTVLPSFGKDVLGAAETIVTLFLAVFCVGVAVGSLFCERLGGRKLEIGLVPFGSIGLTLAAVDLYFASAPLHHVGDSLMGLREFLKLPNAWRMIADFFALAVFGGFFTVPLYTLIQERSEPENRSRVIAGNNILNALFMVLSSLMLMALPKLGVTIPQTFLLLAVMSALVSAYIYSVIPEFLLRFFAWIVAKVMYRIRVVGEENLPDDGPAVLVANHVTYVDWLILSSAYQRPLRFVMHQQFLKLPLVGWAFRDAKVIPIASARENAHAVAHAMDRIAEELEEGNVVCLFPEGELTQDGELGALKPGIEKVVARTPVPVIPVRLDGMWGSYFSRKDGAALRKPFRRIWSRVTLTIGAPIAPEEATVEALRPLLTSPSD
ncbi:MAG: MFS transporter [Myxococcota bacterium]